MDDSVVFLSRSPAARYGRSPGALSTPELDSAAWPTTALATLRSLLLQAGLDRAAQGRPTWSPLSDLVPPGAKVVLKPNWVHHQNQSGEGEEALVTHGEVVAAVLEYLVRARPGSVTIGDAPVQGCSFDSLRTLVGAGALEKRFRDRLASLTILDFRCSILDDSRAGASARASSRSPRDYVLFDLGRESALEPISSDATRFRVTMYDPRALGGTHRTGKHQYLVAREVMEADVVFNLPKLKTHKKAGLTAALKNVVGINGHKEYLPHHRRGGSETGGDNYPGGSRAKWLAELALDQMNLARSASARAAFSQAARALVGLGVLFGSDTNIDGSWAGNDTIWRTTLDLDRILLYGRTDGTLSSTPMRVVVSITDAIVAGEAEGPLAPSPLPIGAMTFATNAAAADVVHARLLGMDPSRIPLVRHAFDGHPYPLALFPIDAVQLCVEGRPVPMVGLPAPGRRARVSIGWRGACELVEEEQ